ncbi:hypothetical protein PHLGIDRAFT_345530 [Phlebiopsis gigantea 11061_1 CR5-6]|uniref:BTB domain-containing protein n=1 Tax=Phlebiopsis gigantea (strain 11061_1 CR5-6) TaxID=745531 RepID=A0A0C3RZ07_PHLG1|nr:hypothetical protein PHLGIDRAFT_345530 [Phlebiopsis gigantea 11061_1 CR5-6]
MEHDGFSFAGGLMLLKVERTLYRIPAYLLTNASLVLYYMTTFLLPSNCGVADAVPIPGVKAVAFDILLDFLLRGRRHSLGFVDLLHLLHLSDRLIVDRGREFALNALKYHPAMDSSTRAHIIDRFGVDDWDLPGEAQNDRDRGLRSQLIDVLDPALVDEYKDGEDGSLTRSKKYFHQIPPAFLQISDDIFQVPVECLSFLGPHIRPFVNFVLSLYPRKGADKSRPIRLKANLRRVETIFDYLWGSFFDQEEPHEDALLLLLKLSTKSAFASTSVHEYAVARLTHHPDYSPPPSRRLRTAHRYNVWQWMIPSLELLLSTPTFELTAADLCNVSELGFWALEWLAHGRHELEESVREIIIRGNSFICSTSCQIPERCAETAGSLWYQPLLHAALTSNGHSLDLDRVVKDLAKRERGASDMCDQCYTLSLANLMLRPEWSPVFMRRLIRKWAMKICDNYRSQYPHRGPPKEIETCAVESLDDLDDVAMTPPSIGSTIDSDSDSWELFTSRSQIFDYSLY